MFALINRLAEVKSFIADQYKNLFYEKKGAGLAFSFDDDFVDEWYGLKDIFKKYSARATFFVSNFDRLPDDAVKKLTELRDDGHEIACHGLRHINAQKFSSVNSIEKYMEAEIFPSLEAMVKRGFAPTTFSYPYGVRSAMLDSALLKYFRHVRGVANTNGKIGLLNAKSIYYRKHSGLVFGAGIDTIYNNHLPSIRQALEKARDKGRILLLFAHKASDETGNYCTPASKIEAVFDHASGIGLKFYRIKDL